MSSTVTPSGKFRAKMLNLMKTLQQECTEKEQIRELEKFKIKFEVGMSANPLATIDLFIRHLTPFAEQILLEDEQFFLTLSVDTQDASDSLLIDNLRKWWHILSDECRDHVKKSIKLLLMLGTIAIKNQALVDVINKYREPDNPLIL
jgi:hypothetical protein